MKNLLTIIFILSWNITMATSFWVDPTSAAGTANGSFATPWKTLSQVQSNMSSFNPGDFIYVKRGTILSGTLNIVRSGNAIAPITFTVYGPGTTAPTLTSSSTDLISISGRQYLVFDGFTITDPNIDPGNRLQQSIIQRAFNLDESNYITVRNCNISLVGVGINMVGDYNTMDHCTIGNLRMIRNTPGGDDDYGANPVVISGSYNTISNNFFDSCWADSHDYLYDGGCIEMYGANNNFNTIIYNTAANSDGFMEVGFSGGGATNNNLVAYNIIINCGELIYLSNDGQYSTALNNMQFYNNAIVQTIQQLTMKDKLFHMRQNSSTQGIIVAKNNIFWLTDGMDVAWPAQWTGGQLQHENNFYHLGTGSVLNFTIDPSEISSTAAIWTNTADANPLNWNYELKSGSAPINAGKSVNIFKDKKGASIQGNPDIGPLEFNAPVTPTPGPNVKMIWNSRIRRYEVKPQQ